MSATEPALTPPAVTRARAHAARSRSPRSRRRRPAGWCRSTPAALPALDAKVAEYVDVDRGARRALPRRSRRRPATCARWATTTSVPPPTRRTGSCRRRCARCSGPLSDAARSPTTLLDLRRTVEDLDPSEATGVKKLLGLIPFGDKLVDYFRKYESAQKHLDAIIKALYDGQDELRKDNAALEQEKVHLWETMQRLAPVHLHRASTSTSVLEARIAQVEATDPEKAKALRDDVLFYVRQKHQDLLTQHGGVDPGLPRDRPRAEEQHRADQGCRPRDHDHDRRAAHGGRSSPRRSPTRSSCSTRSPR